MGKEGTCSNGVAGHIDIRCRRDAPMKESAQTHYVSASHASQPHEFSRRQGGQHHHTEREQTRHAHVPSASLESQDGAYLLFGTG
jgi:hypothetical protein